MLDKLFRKHPKTDELAKAAQAPAQRPDVLYDPGLIVALTYQHRAMVIQLDEARNAAQDGAYDEVKEILEQFKAALASHMKQESIQLYPYLVAHLKGEDSKDILKDMRTNSAIIERSVEGFLSHYGGYPVSEVNAERFDIEIEGVVGEFCEGIEREEASFYTLYLPPESY